MLKEEKDRISNEDQEEFELSMINEKIERKEALHRLMDNQDYKTIFDNMYFGANMARLVMLRGSSNLPPEKKVSIDEKIIGIGALWDFLMIIESEGNTAINELKIREEGDS